MYPKSILHKLLVVVVLSVVLIVSSNTDVRAQLGGDGRGLIQSDNFIDASTIELVDVPGGPGLVMVNPFEFRPYDPDLDKVKFDGAALYNPGPSLSNSTAPLTLPHGARITQLTIYFYDTYVPGDLWLYLCRTSTSGVVSVVTGISTTGINTGFNFKSTTTMDAGTDVVDNRNYSYFLTANFPGGGVKNLEMTNARIDYVYTASLPVILH